MQNQQRWAWSGEDVLTRLRQQITSALGRVLDASQRMDLEWRTAAHAVALGRVAEAARLRAIYP